MRRNPTGVTVRCQFDLMVTGMTDVTVILQDPISRSGRSGGIRQRTTGHRLIRRRVGHVYRRSEDGYECVEEIGMVIVTKSITEVAHAKLTLFHIVGCIIAWTPSACGQMGTFKSQRPLADQLDLVQGRHSRAYEMTQSSDSVS